MTSENIPHPDLGYTVERADRGLKAAKSPSAGNVPGLVRYWEEQLQHARKREEMS